MKADWSPSNPKESLRSRENRRSNNLCIYHEIKLFKWRCWGKNDKWWKPTIWSRVCNATAQCLLGESHLYASIDREYPVHHAQIWYMKHDVILFNQSTWDRQTPWNQATITWYWIVLFSESGLGEIFQHLYWVGWQSVHILPIVQARLLHCHVSYSFVAAVFSSPSTKPSGVKFIMNSHIWHCCLCDWR